MSNKDTFVIVSSPSLDSGSDISKDLMKILADAPDGEMESQLLDIPDDWRPPSHPFARVFYTQLCLVTLGKPDLEELWKDVSHEAGWYKVMGIQFWKGLNLEGSWHPFVVVYKEILQRACIFPCYFVYLTCKWILSASVSAADHSSDENYRTLMAISSTLIVLATCGRIFFTTTTMMMVEEKIWANKPRKTAILTCLAVSRMAEISVAFSWAFLASFGLGVLLEMNSVNYWMFLVGPCTLAPFLDALFKRNARAMIRRGGLAFILWFGVTLGYLQQSWDRGC